MTDVALERCVTVYKKRVARMSEALSMVEGDADKGGQSSSGWKRTSRTVNNRKKMTIVLGELQKRARKVDEVEEEPPLEQRTRVGTEPTRGQEAPVMSLFEISDDDDSLFDEADGLSWDISDDLCISDSEEEQDGHLLSISDDDGEEDRGKGDDGGDDDAP